MKTVIIHEFMIKQMNLKGLELLFFALVYSFNQFGCGFYAKVETVCDFLGCSRSQFFKVKKSLVSKSLIKVEESIVWVNEFILASSVIGQRLTDICDKQMDELYRIASTQWVDD